MVTLVDVHYIVFGLLWLGVLCFWIINYLQYRKRPKIRFSITLLFLILFHFCNLFTLWNVEAAQNGELEPPNVAVVIVNFILSFGSQTSLFIAAVLLAKGWCLTRLTIHITEHRVLYGVAIGFLVVTFFETIYGTVAVVPIIAVVIMYLLMARLVVSASNENMLMMRNCINRILVHQQGVPVFQTLTAIRAKINLLWKLKWSFLLYLLLDFLSQTLGLFVISAPNEMWSILHDAIRLWFVGYLLVLCRRRDFRVLDALPPVLVVPQTIPIPVGMAGQETSESPSLPDHPRFGPETITLAISNPAPSSRQKRLALAFAEA